jgi:murein DD-endopeptidase MepM/ murein hydrolase activator NlpD
VLGASALIVAGAGAVIASSSAAAPAPPSPYAPLAANLDGSDALSYDRGPNAVSVSRDIDRDTLERQAELQAQQRTAALAELARKSQQHANQLKLSQWVLPVAGYRISAGFGDNSSLWSDGHSGLDFAAPSGTPIVSIAQGTVTAVGYSGNCGNMTMVRLDDGTDLMYCHQLSMVVDVGDEVNPGELIGYVGSTGHSTGPHLHLEVRPNGGAPVDPYAALVAHGVRP